MNVETPWTLCGYPGLAIIFFLAAGLGGAAMLWRILRADVGPRDP